MAIKPEDRYVVVGLATQIYCARIMAGELNPNRVSCAAEAAGMLVDVDRHMAPAARKRERPPEIAIGSRHRETVHD